MRGASNARPASTGKPPSSIFGANLRLQGRLQTPSRKRRVAEGQSRHANRSGLAGGPNYGPRGAMRDHGQLSLTVTRIPN
jgi:hypothetical protein